MFVIIPQGALCNRMRSLDSAMAVSSAAGTDLTVDWYIDPNLMGARFEHLFEVPPEISKIITRNYMVRFGKIQKSIQKRLNQIKFKYCLYERDLGSFLKRGGNLVELAETGSLCIASCMHFHKSEPLFRRFKPVVEIRDEVDRIIEGGNRVIGVHIRRGDNIVAKEKSPLKLFESAMNKEIETQSDVTFFLATDCVETENHFRQVYGDRLIIHDKSSLDRNNEIAIKDALIDLYCLSKTNKIIGSAGSSFSNVSAQIEGINLVVMDKNDT